MASGNHTAPDFGGSHRPSETRSRRMKLFVRNIPFVLGDMGLRKLFEEYGTVHEVKVWTPKNAHAENQKTRIGNVVMGTAQMANDAVFGLHEQPPIWLDVQIDISEFDGPDYKETLGSIAKPTAEQSDSRNSQVQGKIVPAGYDLTSISGPNRRNARNGGSSTKVFSQQDKEPTRQAQSCEGSQWKTQSFGNSGRQWNQYGTPQGSVKVIRGRTAFSENGSGTQIVGRGDRHSACNNARCDKLGAQRCRLCESVFYCSRDCQDLDWPKHRSQCVAIKERNIGANDVTNTDPTSRPINQVGGGGGNNSYSGGVANNYSRGGSGGGTNNYPRDGGRRGDRGGHRQWQSHTSPFPNNHQRSEGGGGGGYRSRESGGGGETNRARQAPPEYRSRSFYQQGGEQDQRGPASAEKSPIPFEVGEWSADGNRQADAKSPSDQGRSQASSPFPCPAANVGERLASSPIPGVPAELTEQPTKVIVSHVTNPADFYLQLLANIDILAPMMRHLQLHATRRSPPSDVIAGQLVAAKFSEDQQWYRAVVLCSTDGGWLVKYLDYGNTETRRTNDLRALDDNLFSVIPMAVNCCLEGFDVPTEKISSPKMVSRFQALVGKGDVYAGLVDGSGNRPVVRLADSLLQGTDIGQSLRAACCKNVKSSCIVSWKMGTENLAVINEVAGINRFWLTGISADEPSIGLLDERLTVACNKVLLGDQRSESLHPVVAALNHQDLCWYRAVITERLEQGWQVVYLDHGSCDTVFRVQSLPLSFAGVRSRAVLLEADSGFTSEQRNHPPPPPSMHAGHEVWLTPVNHHEHEVCVVVRTASKQDDRSTSFPFHGRALSVWSQLPLPDVDFPPTAEAPDLLPDVLRAEPKEVVIGLQRLETKCRLYVQVFCQQTGPVYETLQRLPAELVRSEVVGMPSPNLGDLVCLYTAADDEWHRARVIGLSFDEMGALLTTAWLLDVGRAETVGQSSLAPLPAAFHQLPRLCTAVQPVFSHDGVTLEVLREVMFAEPGTYWKLQVVDPIGVVKVILKDHRNRSLDELLELRSAALEPPKVVTILSRPTPASPTVFRELPAPPALAGRLTCFPAFLESVELLYVQAIHDDTALLLNELEELHAEIEAAKAMPGGFGLTELPAVGHTVCALYEEDDTWYRARVEARLDDTAEVDVQFVDYGNRGRCSLANLCPVPERYRRSRCMASTVRPVTSAGASFPDHDSLNRVLFAKFDASWSANIVEGGDDVGATRVAILSDDQGRSLEELLATDAASKPSPANSEEDLLPTNSEVALDGDNPLSEDVAVPLVSGDPEYSLTRSLVNEYAMQEEVDGFADFGENVVAEDLPEQLLTGTTVGSAGEVAGLSDTEPSPIGHYGDDDNGASILTDSVDGCVTAEQNIEICDDAPGAEPEVETVETAMEHLDIDGDKQRNGAPGNLSLPTDASTLSAEVDDSGAIGEGLSAMEENDSEYSSAGVDEIITAMNRICRRISEIESNGSETLFPTAEVVPDVTEPPGDTDCGTAGPESQQPQSCLSDNVNEVVVDSDVTAASEDDAIHKSPLMVGAAEEVLVFAVDPDLSLCRGPRE